jgi:hypothetical protein
MIIGHIPTNGAKSIYLLFGSSNGTSPARTLRSLHTPHLNPQLFNTFFARHLPQQL